MEHAAWVFPRARGPWAEAMQNELPQIENDLKALAWASGCLAASYVEKGRAMTRQQKKFGLAALRAVTVISFASWWARQWWYHVTPGTDLVFREDSNAGAMAGFLVFLTASIPAVAVFFGIHDGTFQQAARAGRVCAVIIGPYLAALVLVSLPELSSVLAIVTATTCGASE